MLSLGKIIQTSLNDKIIYNDSKVLLNQIHKLNIKQACVSASPQMLLNKKLQEVQIENLFEYIIGGDMVKRNKLVQGEKLRGAEKVRRIPIKVIPSEKIPKKPKWIRVRVPDTTRIAKIKKILRDSRLATVCEEATCPNLPECFSHGTATFMIMGEICTRRCPFCDVAHGKPNVLDPDEPRNLALAIADMQLKYVVVTSVDRDDLKDSGAGHFAECIDAIRKQTPAVRLEIFCLLYTSDAADE